MTSAGPTVGASTRWGTVGAADLADLAGTTGIGEVATTVAVAVDTMARVVNHYREVPVDNPECGDQDCHNRNNFCWPANNPLCGV